VIFVALTEANPFKNEGTKIKKDGGVEVTDLGDNMVQLKDNSGFSITRHKYEWE